MERDIVQFVPYLTFKNDPMKLAKETLDEVPRQLTSYMNSKRIPPTKQQLMNVQTANFFEEDKRLFVNQLESMGLDKDKINDILNQGLPANSVDLFLTHEKKPKGAYNNVLAK